MFTLTGKTALVTGATGGIGSTIAKILHAQGATVGINDLNIEALDKLAAEMKDRCHVFPGNLTAEGATDALVESAEKEMGKIDILVNNAGLTRDGLFMRMKDEDWQLVQDINLTAPFRLIRSAIRSMMKQRNGRVINIASVVGVTGNAGQANYCASKAGLVGMTKAMAAEVASRGITLNCIAPGSIATAMTDALTDEQRNKINVTIPMGIMGTPEDVANAVVFLASDEAKYITGQTLHVNGGMVMV